MDLFAQIVEKIVSYQENVIGPVAVEQAQDVEGLELDWGSHTVKITGDSTQVVESLVHKYKDLFGQASVEVCRDAAGPLLSNLPEDKVPESLK